MAFNMIYMFLSVCHFKKETIRVKPDCLSKKSQAQKRFEIAYKDIDSIELVNLQAGFDTQNKQIMEKGNDKGYIFFPFGEDPYTDLDDLYNKIEKL